MTALLTDIGSDLYQASGLRRPPALVQLLAGSPASGLNADAPLLAARRHAVEQIERDLMAWWKAPDQFADDETAPPSRLACQQALRFVRQLKADGMQSWPLLSHLRPTGISVGSGGAVSVELAGGPLAMTFTFESDGSSEQFVFASGKLLARHQLASTAT